MLFLYHESEEVNATEPISTRENYLLSRIRKFFYHNAKKLSAFLPFRKRTNPVAKSFYYDIIDSRAEGDYIILCLESIENAKDTLEEKIDKAKINELNGSARVMVIKSDSIIILNKYGRRIK